MNPLRSKFLARDLDHGLAILRHDLEGPEFLVGLHRVVAELAAHLAP